MFPNDFWIEVFLRALTGCADLNRPMSTENLVGSAEAIADYALTTARMRGMIEDEAVQSPVLVGGPHEMADVDEAN